VTQPDFLDAEFRDADHRYSDRRDRDQRASDRRDTDQRDSESASATHDQAENQAGSRQLHPLPRGLVELYGLLAVLFVLVPEWMAGGALLGFKGQRNGSELPPTAAAWRKLPELRLAGMSLAELRQLAHSLKIPAYMVDRRDRLTARLLRRILGRKALW
jgi:hypothetical protein